MSLSRRRNRFLGAFEPRLSNSRPKGKNGDKAAALHLSWWEKLYFLQLTTLSWKKTTVAGKKKKHKPFRLLTSAVKTPHSLGETHYHQIIYTLEEEIYFRARASIGFDEEKHGVSSRWNITKIWNLKGRKKSLLNQTVCICESDADFYSMRLANEAESRSELRLRVRVLEDELHINLK